MRASDLNINFAAYKATDMSNNDIMKKLRVAL